MSFDMCWWLSSRNTAKPIFAVLEFARSIHIIVEHIRELPLQNYHKDFQAHEFSLWSNAWFFKCFTLKLGLSQSVYQASVR